MIEFFEFLNTCSPSRTLVYLVFIVIVSFIVFAGVADILRRLRGGEVNNHYYVNGEEVDDGSIRDNENDVTIARYENEE